ncbi:alpha/beta hydrolase [Streptomyces yaanensis]|uniref:Alpha/beta hydrolase n=1 Tax=Streptomyces yaanensis TaxID=1142239 RepID=A0ABV7S5V6_9ACTN|nr:alpha/beta hydrolase [Streptomyces sp. CGMCC 4.7035]WNB99753.1 alpha/beta hydrolase [Streptomyces sp. CGMCC 4.7035]
MLSTHRRRAVTSAAATTAVLALLGVSPPSMAPADGGGPDLSRFYHQKITWSACKGEDMPDDLQCGKVTVPLDYARPSAGTLDLAMARYRATGKSRGSVLLNFGGPGGAGIPELATGGKDFMGLTNGYDVVTFDPRGVGQSSPVSCGEDSDEDSGATDRTDLSDPQAALKQVRKLATQCAKHSGPVLPHIGTVNASRDMDVMRQALGDKKLNYLGFSYGTRLGAVYAAQFPKKVGRMALDGVDTLTEPLTEQGLVAAEGQQTALESFIDWCVKGMACPFGDDTRTARQEVVHLVDSLDANPLPTDSGTQFSGQDLVGAIGQALFSKQMWPLLEQALARLVEEDDPTGILRFSSGWMAFPLGHRTDRGVVDPEDVPSDNLPAALMAINCADDPDRPSAGQVTRDIARLRDQYAEASPVFGTYRLTQVLMCFGRPKGTDFIREKVKNVHTAKMLLVGTRGDPATPYRWTLETARRLGSSAVVLDNRSVGHTGYASSPCVHEKVDSFLLYGSLPSSGSSCGAPASD